MDNQQNNQKYRFNFISEAAADQDLLSDKVHQSTADTIYNLIENSDRAITIALDGEFGSGKSTVIKLLKQKYKFKKTLFYIFDAWAHEGDPLRKIFLEKLIRIIERKRTDEKISELNQLIINNTNTKKVKTTKSASL